ncbi:MAG: MobA/MobL family protein [Methylobacteriaceae bacterium]|nr:MobA/MobL family protein [Methylobacteriaceae bacterium]
MASYHFKAGYVSFGKGQSAVAKAAYNSRMALRNERDDHKTSDYRRGGGEVLFSGIFAPKDAPEWASDREQLWNRAEAMERQWNGQPARGITIALPHELTDQQREWLVKDFVRQSFVRQGMVADVNIHRPDRHGDQRNFHAHILLTTREIGPEGFAETKQGKAREEWTANELLAEWKDRFAAMGAKALEKNGFEIEAARFRHGHKKLAEQREEALARGDTEWAQHCDREATLHLGPQAASLERDGIKTEIGDQNREIADRNALRQELREEYDRISAEIIDLDAERAKRGDRVAETENTPDLAADGETLPQDGASVGQSDRPGENLAAEAPDAEFADSADKLAHRNARLGSMDDYERDEAAEVAAWENALSDNAIFRDIIAPKKAQRIEAQAEPVNDRPLSEAAGNIRLAYQLSDSGASFLQGLRDRGLSLAVVSAEEADQSYRLAVFARELGNFAPTHREGDLVAVNGFGNVYGLSRSTTGDSRDEIAAYLATVDRTGLHNVSETRVETRAASLEAFRMGKLAARPETELESLFFGMQWENSEPAEIVAAIQAEGLYLARASAKDIADLAAEHRDSFAAEDRASVPLWLSSAIEEGELVAVDRFGAICRINRAHVSREALAELWTSAAPEGFGAIGDIASVRGVVLDERAEEAAAWQEARDERAAENLERATTPAEGATDGVEADLEGTAADAADGAAKGADRLLGAAIEALSKVADAAATAVEGFLAPPSPAEQIAAKRAAAREATAAPKTPAPDFARLSDQERQQRATALMQRLGEATEGNDLAAEQQAQEAAQARRRDESR